MFISFDTIALTVCNNMNRSIANAGKLMMQISSGCRINSAADDPSGSAISQRMRAQIRGLNIAAKNAQDAISMMQLADGAVNESHSMLQRVRELLIQASSDTMNPDDREQIQCEINELIDAINSISKDTEFNTIKLLDGSKSLSGNGMYIQIGAGSGNHMELNIGDMGAHALGIDNIDISGKSPDEISDMIKAVDDAICKVSSERGSLGSKINVLEMRIDYLNTAAENLEAADSRIRDVDIAKAIMDLTKEQLKTQISMVLLSYINHERENLLYLLLDSFSSKDEW